MLKLKHTPLWQLLSPIKYRMSVAALLQILASLCSLIPYAALLALSQALFSGEKQAALQALFYFVMGLGLHSGLGAIALWLTHIADHRLQALLRSKLISKLAKLPLSWFNHHASGEIRQLIQEDVESLHQLVAHTLVEMLAATLTPLMGIGFCFYLDWKLGIAATAPLLLYLILFSLCARYDMRGIMEEINRHLQKVSATITEYVNGVAVLKIFAKSEMGYSRFDEASSDFYQRFSTLVQPAMRAQGIALCALSAPVIIIIMSATAFLPQAPAPEHILIATLIALFVPGTLMTLALSSQVRAAAQGAAQRIYAFLQQAELTNAKTIVPLSAIPHLRVSNLSFGYAEHRILEHINADFPPKTHSAIVGSSGAGKSTLAALLARFQDIEAGSISLDGQELRHIPLSQLQETIGILGQQAPLLHASIADNIRLGKSASEEQLIAAAKRACIHERIMQLEKGYDSIIGTEARLSGGEIQRIHLARLILHAPPIIIFDEATAATDPLTQQMLSQAIEELTQQHSIISISHRLASIAHADQILVMDKGRIVEQGKHSELLAKKGLYYQLWHSQHTSEQV